MPHILWDASALTKRYALEDGTPTVNALFDKTTPLPMLATFLGYVETVATLWRKRNRGVITANAYQASASSLRAEVLLASAFELLTIPDDLLLGAIAYVQRYNLNASDAAILAAFLRYQQITGETCVIVAADRRLMAAAVAEGLATLNPETLATDDVSVFLASL